MGAVVAFVSLASNLVPNDINACNFFANRHCPDIFVHGGLGRRAVSWSSWT
jgi:hypothetical protein